MLSRLKYCTGIFATYDTWDHYWEGDNFRSNANIGAVTTRTYAYVGNYGLTDRINLLVNVPYVRTSTSQGVLHGQAGFQDVTFSVKVKAISLPIGRIGALRAIAVVSGSQPMSRYTPDDLPVSIGSQSQTLSGRGTLNYLGHDGLYLNGGAAYTFRSNVTLPRSSYYTNGQLYLTNQVAMPNQFGYTVSAGYRKNDTTLVATFQQQRTRGGSDIRPQDVPFVSDRFDYSKFGGTLTVPLPRIHALQYWAIYSYTLDGRNVGKASTGTTGFLYTFDFERGHTK